MKMLHYTFRNENLHQVSPSSLAFKFPFARLSRAQKAEQSHDPLTPPQAPSPQRRPRRAALVRADVILRVRRALGGRRPRPERASICGRAFAPCGGPGRPVSPGQCSAS